MNSIEEQENVEMSESTKNYTHGSPDIHVSPPFFTQRCEIPKNQGRMYRTKEAVVPAIIIEL